jgi:hypothetical protein
MYKLSFFLCFVVLLSLLPTSYAQQCGTPQKVQQALQNPAVAARRAPIHTQILAKAQEKQAASTGNIYTIPVVVHVLYHTPAQNLSQQRINEQLQTLNEDFRRQNADGINTPLDFLPVAADAQIQFCLATRDPNGQPTTGITRRAVSQANIGNGSDYYRSSAGGQDAWDTNRYLNIWVCDIGGGLLGFTYIPGTAPAGADGVVIHYSNFGRTGASAPFDAGRTTTHEVGHWLNLEHLWGNGGCSQDDGIGDTPDQAQESNGCPTHPTVSCGSADMFMNFMDYTDDVCMNMFTQGQRDRMRATIQAVRPNLLLGQACVTVNDDAGAQIAAPGLVVCTDSLRAAVLLYNYGTNPLLSATLRYQLDNGTVSSLLWTGNLSPTQYQRLQLPALLLSNSGNHRFRVWTERPNQQSDPIAVNDTSSLNFATRQPQQLPLLETFQQQAGLPNGWDVYNPDNGITWARTTLAGQSSSASFFMDNWDYQNQLGAVDRLLLPPVEMPTNTIPFVQFAVAYAGFSQGYGDTLRVQASDNCGQTWTTVYEKGGTALSTVAGLRSTEFVPQPNEWRQEGFTLPAYQGVEALQLRFEQVSEAENNLYLDNISISLLNASSQPAKPQLWSRLSPNPSRGRVQLEVRLPRSGKVLTWQLYNGIGQLLMQQRVVADAQSRYELSLTHLPKGIYFLAWEWEGERRVERLVRH